jgi:hypothetical protein
LPDAQQIDLNLAPYESRLLFFSNGAKPVTPEPPRRETVLADLSRQWTMALGEQGTGNTVDRLSSWTNDPKTKFYSGTATYEKDLDLRSEQLAHPAKLFLDFGQGTPEALPPPNSPHTMRAYLDPPVHEAAQIVVNGKSAGFVWRPPYRVDISAFVHPGPNHLRIVVGNTAINELAGQPLPDYRLLWARYGMRAVPQDMKDLRPLPSGLIGPITLVQSSTAH